MSVSTLKYFYEKASGHNPSFYYRGPFLEKFTNTLLEISSGAANRDRQDGNVSKKMSFMIVECFQNILKHAENKENIRHILEDEGLFSFKDINGTFVINSINVIQNHEITKVESLVTKVNSLNEADLKQYYLDNLRNNTISDRGGAGLGLIEMARKSGEKILHKIENIDDNYSYFHQQVTMHNGGNLTDHKIQLEESGSLYRRMIDEEMVLMYKGDFNQKSILPLLELAEYNVREKSSSQRRTMRAAHVTVEVLQNISKHSGKDGNKDDRFGMFMLGKRADELVIIAGNVVSMEEKLVLENKLDYLISLDHQELKELHKTTLLATLKFENKTNSGLGLIEVAQASSRSLEYHFLPYADQQFLFVLQVII